MKCLRCETSVLEERERDGVTIDVCPKCRGIWLDRGELEKLIARAVSEQEAPDRRSAPIQGNYERDGDRERNHEHHGHEDHGYRSGHHGHKRSGFDIFD
jgi:uncharacterized protein